MIRTERGIVADWLLKLVLGIAVFGLILFDAGAILVNLFTLDSSADDVAIAVSLQVNPGERTGFTDDEIFEMAKDLVADEDEGVANARVLRKGTGIDDEGVVSVRLKRNASTLLVHRIGAIEEWAEATADGKSGTT